MKVPFLLGRLIYGGFFVYNGVNHFLQARKLSEYAASKGVPFPRIAVAASGAVLILAGGSVLLGVKPKYGVLGIAGFLGSVEPIMHDFWRQPDPAQRDNELIHFSKSMALLGAGLGLLGVEEPWPASLPAEQVGHAFERVQRAARRLAA